MSIHKHWVLERSYISPHLSVSCAEADYRCILVWHAHLAQDGPAGCDPGEQPVLWDACQHHPSQRHSTQHTRVAFILKHANRRRTANSYLLVKILRRQEEVVERDEVSLQKSHQQDQIHTICKLQTHFSQNNTVLSQIDITHYSGMLKLLTV